MRSIGIDVGVGKGFDVVAMDERRNPVHVAPHATLDDIARMVEELRPDVVAVDSPSRWATNGRSRLTENELARLNIHAFRTPSPEHADGNHFDWMRAGMEAFALLDRLGYPLFTGGPFRGRSIEVFPHATAAVLTGCLAPNGMRKRAWRERVLRMQGVRTEDLTTIDQIDAALAALTGVLVLEGLASYLGDPHEGVIVVPARALAPIYRAGRLADDGSTQLFAWCACGAPECDRMVPAGREFAPGHDAKRKSALWKQIREGRAAAEELGRRKWELPTELR